MESWYDNWKTDDGYQTHSNCCVCGEKFDDDEMIEHNDGYICEECFELEEVECEKCHTLMPRIDLSYDEGLDMKICEECKNESNK